MSYTGPKQFPMTEPRLGSELARLVLGMEREFDRLDSTRQSTPAPVQVRENHAWKFGELLIVDTTVGDVIVTLPAVAVARLHAGEELVYARRSASNNLFLRTTDNLVNGGIGLTTTATIGRRSLSCDGKDY